MTRESEFIAEAEKWLQIDQNETTKKEMKTLLANKDFKELEKRFSKRMEFGTAGLRARMGAGYAMMNDVTIIQTTQGFVKYMEKICPNLKENGVVIGYDARHNSKRWAHVVAGILINRGITTYLYSKITPTPYVPFGVLNLGCDWGIMITASHNPKEDNGYKVYYSNGAQIISPHDIGISESILENLEPWDSSWDYKSAIDGKLCTDPYSDMHSQYMERLHELCNFRETNQKSPLKFTYTAMHGVGCHAVMCAFEEFGHLPFIPVKEQVEPDPEFPTVVFPNPEEGKSALNLAMETADRHGSTVILANDPDADRLAAAEKQSNGSWHVFSGNEIGSLIGWWLWTQHKRSNSSNAADNDVYCLASAVSSRILKSISDKEGFNFVETLTGFKWMGNMASTLMKQGKTVLFAFEEAIGFMCGTNVLDKDGVSAAAVLAEMASYLAAEGTSLKQQLNNIYERYGHHISMNSYYLCYEAAPIKAIFQRLRNYQDDKYPKSCGPFGIKDIRDLTTGFDSSQPDNLAILPVSASSEMITFTFENNCVVTLRTSGTEPKIKYYTEIIAEPEKGLSMELASEELKKLVACVIEEFIQPELHQLIPKS